MRTRFSIRRRSSYPWLFALLAIAANAAVAHFHAAADPQLFLAVTGAVAALVHFLYAQHHQDTTQFIALFRDFNSRYDALNGALNDLFAKDPELVFTTAETKVLFDYFNLCAEEWLYFSAGYIDADVWNSWLRGMGLFASHPEIRRVWEAELNSGSYYGFALALVDAV